MYTSLRLVCWCVAFSAVAIKAADPELPQIVTLGDSITKGVRPGVRDEETFARIIESALRSNGQEIKVINVGIGGERTDGALARLTRDVLSRKPMIVTIMYGTNDSYVDKGATESRLSVRQYQDNLRQLVEQLRKSHCQPILMTEPRWGAKAAPNGRGEHPNVRLVSYVEACRSLAKELNCPLVDHFQIWTTAEEQGMDIGDWTTDQCHPNAEGHRRIADAILPVVSECLKTLK